MTTAPYRRHAWTGGDVPRRGLVLASTPLGRRYRAIRHDFFREQLMDWRSGWGDLPDRDTRAIFWNRASLDAWRTLTEEHQLLGGLGGR